MAFFISLQSFSLAHATEHRGEAHEHEGVACAVTVLAEDVADILPTPPVYDAPEIQLSETIFVEFYSAPYLAPQSRAPPPRGPPNAI